MNRSLLFVLSFSSSYYPNWLFGDQLSGIFVATVQENVYNTAGYARSRIREKVVLCLGSLLCEKSFYH